MTTGGDWSWHCVQLLGGLTTIDIKLRGFNDSSKHGLLVHDVGSADEQCGESGLHLNPDNKMHGGPDDEERSC